MIDVVTQFCVEWLTDPAAGLAAQLVNVPRRPGDGVPPAVTIYNALDHDWVARATAPADKLADGPVLTIRAAVSFEEPVLAPLLPERHQKTPPEVFIQFTTILKRGAPAVQRRNAGYVLRTVLRVLAQRFDTALTTYIREDVVVRLGDSPPGLVTQLIDVGDDQCLGAVSVPFTCLDRWALGIT